MLAEFHRTCFCCKNVLCSVVCRTTRLRAHAERIIDDAEASSKVGCLRWRRYNWDTSPPFSSHLWLGFTVFWVYSSLNLGAFFFVSGVYFFSRDYAFFLVKLLCVGQEIGVYRALCWRIKTGAWNCPPSSACSWPKYLKNVPVPRREGNKIRVLVSEESNLVDSSVQLCSG